MFKKLSPILLIVILMLGFTTVSADEGEHAHIRAAHYVVDAPNVDIFVDGEAVLEDFAYTGVSDYMELEPGTYSIAVAPTGEGMEAAVIGPMDVEVEAGHTYTLMAYGQMADETFASKLLDETAEIEAAGLSDSLVPVILFQGISEIEAVDIYAAGSIFLEGIPFGEIKVIEFPLVNIPITITAAGDPETIVLEETFFGVPNTLALSALMGSYPDNVTRVITNTTDLTAFEFLQGATVSPIISFDTLVTAIGALVGSGMALPETEENSTFFAPTDNAFEALPEGAVDELLADPELLAALLLYHGVQGPLYSWDIVGMLDESGMATVTTALGEDITIAFTEEGVFINETAQLIYVDIRVSDGIIHIIDGVLMPPMDDE